LEPALELEAQLCGRHVRVCGADVVEKSSE
jgi:hypothetical protein